MWPTRSAGFRAVTPRLRLAAARASFTKQTSRQHNTRQIFRRLRSRRTGKNDCVSLGRTDDASRYVALPSSSIHPIALPCAFELTMSCTSRPSASHRQGPTPPSSPPFSHSLCLYPTLCRLYSEAPSIVAACVPHTSHHIYNTPHHGVATPGRAATAARTVPQGLP